MRTLFDVRRGPWFVLVTLSLVTLSLGAVGCGGGGGDGGEIEPATLPVYAFGMQETTGAEPFEVSFSDGGDDFTVSILFPAMGLQGTFDTETGDHAISPATLVDVDSDAGPTALYGMFRIDVTAMIDVPADDWPTSGSFAVSYPMNTVTVTFGVTGVTIQLNINAPTMHSFEEFEDMPQLPVATYLKQASFAWSVLAYLLDMSDFVSASFDFMDEDLHFFNPRTENCDGFAPTYTGPLGIDDPGFYTFGWNDVNLDDEIGPGDLFNWSFFDCWQNDPGDDIDLLYETGTVRLENFTEVVAGNTLVRIGYEPGVGDGGVYFNDLVESETRDNLGVVDIEQSRTLNGAFQIAWWQP